jgi:small-conductance mechanosensitive channel
MPERSLGGWLSRIEELGTVEARLIETVLVVLVLVLIRQVVLAVALRGEQDPRLRYRWSKTSTYVAALFGLLVVGRIWFTGFHSVATFLGLVGAGLAVALRDVVVNLAGWIFIVTRRPFVVGDRIQIGTQAGDVIDQRLFQFTLLEIGNWVDADQSTGRLVHVPNGVIFTQPQASFTSGFPFIWHEIPVRLSFESNWRAAREQLLEIVARHAGDLPAEAERRLLEVSSRFLIFYTTLTPTVYTTVREFGVVLTVRYLCEPRRRRGTEQAIWEDILTAFAARDDIAFAYPTQRFFDHAAEGKPALRAGAGSDPGVR